MPKSPFLVAFTAYKGGTGKSTVAFNTGLEFARPREYEGVPSRPVVFFDLDPQCRSQQGGRTLSRLFDDGPFSLRPLNGSPSPNLELKLVEYDPDEAVPIRGFGSFSHYELVREDPVFVPVILAAPRGRDTTPSRIDELRRVLDEANELLAQHVEESWPEYSSFLKVLERSPPLGVMDTPPMNMMSEDIAGLVGCADLVVPVVDPENVKQIPQFHARYGNRMNFAVVNRVPSRNLTREYEFFEKILSRFLQRGPIKESDVVRIPERPVIRFASALGIPVRARPDRGRGCSKYFHEVAWRIQNAWSERDENATGRLI